MLGVVIDNSSFPNFRRREGFDRVTTFLTPKSRTDFEIYK